MLNTLLDASSEVLRELPTYISDNNISQFVLKFNELNICEGNNEFGDVLNRRIDFMEPFPSQDGARSAVVEASIRA